MLEHEQEQNAVLARQQQTRQAKNGSIGQEKYTAVMGYKLEAESESLQHVVVRVVLHGQC